MSLPSRFCAFVLISVLILFGCKKNSSPVPSPQPPASTQIFIKGIDLSFAPEIALSNISFSENNTVKPILNILKDKGINTVRLRLWNNPSTIHSSLQEVMLFAKQAKALGFKFWLDLHYSDTWADPGNQTKPAGWSSLSFAVLKDSVYQFTKNCLSYLLQNNASPDYVQVGNEINVGFLWNEGKINNLTDTNWPNFADLLKQGTRAIREVIPSAKIILHIAGYDYAQSYFQKLQTYAPDFDIIGLSYYPWWHGMDMNMLKQTLDQLNTNFHKPLLIAETAYPFTLQWNDWTNNFVGLSSQLIPGYDATTSGQAKFLSDLKTIVRSSSSLDHAGVCYWAGDYVAYKGTMATDGSPWENLALFDFQFKALPALDSLGK